MATASVIEDKVQCLCGRASCKTTLVAKRTKRRHMEEQRGENIKEVRVQGDTREGV